MIIPFTVLGFGTGLVVWATGKIADGEDVDSNVKQSLGEFIQGLPKWIAEHIAGIAVRPDGALEVRLKADAGPREADVVREAADESDEFSGATVSQI